MFKFNHESAVNQNKILGVCLMLVAAFDANAEESVGLEILPVDEAFRLGYVENDPGMTVFWQVAPSHYLYRDRISFSRGDQLLSIEVPEGEERQDEIFGLVQVLEGLIEVEVLDLGVNSGVKVRYQGCAEGGYCYPPQEKSLSPIKNSLFSEKIPNEL